MGRYIKDVQLEQPIDVVSMVMDDFVYHNRFSRTDWNGEMVYYLKDRHGRERYMKWFYVDGVFHVEAWLKNPFGDEMDLDGVGGGASRKEYRRSMDELIETLKKQPASSVAGGHVGSDPLHHDSGHGSNHDSWRADTEWQQGYSGADSHDRVEGRASAPEETSNASGERRYYGSLFPGVSIPELRGKGVVFCALAALLLAWWSPVFGIILALVALNKREDCTQSNLIKVVSILAICEAGCELLISIMGFIYF